MALLCGACGSAYSYFLIFTTVYTDINPVRCPVLQVYTDCYCAFNFAVIFTESSVFFSSKDPIRISGE